MDNKKIKSIHSTIFNKMVLTVCLTAAIAIFTMLVMVYVFFVNTTKTEIIESTRNTASYMNTLKSTQTKIDFLGAMFDDITGERETLIAPNGSILFDNEADITTLENHLSRPEVKEAIEKGIGEANRSSHTVGERVFYCAVMLDDGSIFRTAKPSMVVTKMMFAIIPGAIILLFVIFITIWFLSRWLTRKIMNPIYKINVNDIDESIIYPELLPYFKRIEKENAEREKTESIRREFSANVSHELKTPLTSISGYAQMINNGMVKPEDVSLFGLKIEKEAERLLLLIDDIIRLSNLDETTIVTKERINLNEVVSEVLINLETQIAKKEVDVYYSGDDCYINGKRTLIEELAYNLIDNAIKYNEQKGRLDIYVGKSPNGKEISVSDTGIGIPEEDIDRIYERFYRVDKSHSKKIGGTGLGLSIVKHVVMVHNAKIETKSKLGRGTTITVTFPNK